MLILTYVNNNALWGEGRDLNSHPMDSQSTTLPIKLPSPLTINLVPQKGLEPSKPGF